MIIFVCLKKKKKNYYKSKSSAQDAHEAIRPTHPELTPDMVKASGVSNDQYKLYKLIWERFIASQMSNCLMDTVSVDIDANGCGFKATGYSVKFDGFTALYEESKDDDSDKKKNVLPAVTKGEQLKVHSLEGNQHFTQPPARYTEATLVKAFEEANGESYEEVEGKENIEKAALKEKVQKFIVENAKVK